MCYWDETVWYSFFCSFLFLVFCLFGFFSVVGRSTDFSFRFCFFVMFCFVFATVHIAAALKTFKKNCWKKKKKKGKRLKKKINSYTLFSTCGWVPRFFHVFGVFLICRSVHTGCVLDFLQEVSNPAWSRPWPVPICSYSMKSCTWPFCSNKCAIFINRLWHSCLHFSCTQPSSVRRQPLFVRSECWRYWQLEKKNI